VNELAIKIDDALRQAGRRDEAVQRLDRWLAAHPDDVRAQAYKAQTLMARGEFKPASSLLEGVLERQPGNAVVLNNLALAYQELGDARARATAEAAYKRAGEQPDVMDTLAWILVDEGEQQGRRRTRPGAAAEGPRAGAESARHPLPPGGGAGARGRPRRRAQGARSAGGRRHALRPGRPGARSAGDAEPRLSH
jgi:tetratricopeptide (TPR) repeat protein